MCTVIPVTQVKQANRAPRLACDFALRRDLGHARGERALLVAEERLAEGVDVDFMRAKIATARFYGDHILSKAPGLRDSIVDGALGVTGMALDAF